MRFIILDTNTKSLVSRLGLAQNIAPVTTTVHTYESQTDNIVEFNRNYDLAGTDNVTIVAESEGLPQIVKEISWYNGDDISHTITLLIQEANVERIIFSQVINPGDTIYLSSIGLRGEVGPAGGVISVNGATGVVILNLDDINDVPTYPNDGNSYVLTELNGTLTWELVGAASQDGVVDTATLNGTTLELTRTEGLPQLDVDLSSLLGAELTSLSVITNPAGIASLSYNNLTGEFTYTPPDLSPYLTSFTETDPVFGASPAAGITGTQITNWDNAFSWGDHALAGYLTSETPQDLQSVLDTGSVVTNGTTMTFTDQDDKLVKFVMDSGFEVVGRDELDTTTRYILSAGAGQMDYFLGNAAAPNIAFEMSKSGSPNRLRIEHTFGAYRAVNFDNGSTGDVLTLIDSGTGQIGFAAASGGIALTDLSVGPQGTPAGDGSLAYDNLTGVFTYTPPELFWEIGTIGAGFSVRIPTITEWTDETNSWGVVSNGSVSAQNNLALPSGGRRLENTSLNNVGSGGYYWSSSVSGTSANALSFSNSSGVFLDPAVRGRAFSVRLIVDGTFTQQEFDDDFLNETIEIDSTTYGFLYNSTTNRIWLDRNLGASQVSTGATDSAAYGDLYQWGRAADGHESRTSGFTTTLSTTDTPPHGDFIAALSFPNDWRDGGNDNLWQGVGGINVPSTPSSSKLIGRNGLKADYNDLLNLPTIPSAGIDLTDLSVGPDDPALGSGGLAYDNSTGVFTYTPPDLSAFQSAFEGIRESGSLAGFDLIIDFGDFGTTNTGSMMQFDYNNEFLAIGYSNGTAFNFSETHTVFGANYIQAINPNASSNTFIGFLTASGSWNINFPAASGTLALLSDISSFDYIVESGTPLGGDLSVRIGDIPDEGSGLLLEFDDNEEWVIFGGNNGAGFVDTGGEYLKVLRNGFEYADGVGFATNFSFEGPSASRSILIPDASGTIVLDSQLGLTNILTQGNSTSGQEMIFNERAASTSELVTVDNTLSFWSRRPLDDGPSGPEYRTLDIFAKEFNDGNFSYIINRGDQLNIWALDGGLLDLRASTTNVVSETGTLALSGPTKYIGLVNVGDYISFSTKTDTAGSLFMYTDVITNGQSRELRWGDINHDFRTPNDGDVFTYDQASNTGQWTAPSGGGGNTLTVVSGRISVQADGTVNGSQGLSVTKGATGVYNYTFDTPQPNANYAVSGVMTMPTGWTDTNISVVSKTVNGFTVEIAVGDNSTTPDVLADHPHDIIVMGDGLGPTIEATWGGITGTLSDQTDLQAALNSKVESGANLSIFNNDVGFITGISALSDVSDVPAYPVSAGNYYLDYDQGLGSFSWVDVSTLGGGGGASQLSDLNDVGVVGYTNRHVLVADGTNYDSRALVEADISDLQAYLLPADLTGYVQTTDIDTLAKVNAIITDASLIDTNDPRLSDARTPLAHTHVVADITDFPSNLVDATGAPADNQLAIWTDANTIEGAAALTYDTTNGLRLFPGGLETPEVPDNGQTISVYGDGAAYFKGRDVTNNIEFIMGTSTAGVAFVGSMTNHGLDIRINNQDAIVINTNLDSQFLGNISFSATHGLNLGGNLVTDILTSGDASSTSNSALVTAGYVNTHAGGGPEVNDLTAAVTWANIPDANVPATAVTQHEAALTITESQISDLQNYLLASDIDTLAKLNLIVGDATIASQAWVTGQGYLTSFTETDPVFAASQAFNITAGDITNLGNLSGVNTGDETIATIQSKRPLGTVDGKSIEGGGTNIRILDGPAVSAYDWDTVITSGTFRGNGSTTNRPSGFNGFETVFVYTTNGSYIVQTCVDGLGDSLATRRSIDTGTTWSAWQIYAAIGDVVTDHTALSNIGTNSHAQIDTHIADGTVHFTQASISIPLSQLSDVPAYPTGGTANHFLEWNENEGTFSWVDTSTLGGGGGGLNNVVEDLTPQLGGNLDAQNNDITGVGTLFSTNARFGGATALRAFNVRGSLLDGRISIQGTSDADNPGFEITVDDNASRVLARLNRVGTNGTEFQIFTEPDGGGIGKHAVFGDTGELWMFPQGSSTTATNNAGIRNNSGTMQFKDAAGSWTNMSSGGGGASQLSDLSDVNTSAPTNRNVLVADGVDWESRALVEADISNLQSYMLNLVDDLSPQLGGDLDFNTWSATNLSDIYAGDSTPFFLQMDESTSMTFNSDSLDSDFIVNGTQGDVFTVDAGTNRVVIGDTGLLAANWPAQIQYESTPVNNNIAWNVLGMIHLSQGTPAVGFGVGHQHAAETQPGLIDILGAFQTYLTSVGASNSDATYRIQLASNSVLGTVSELTHEGVLTLPEVNNSRIDAASNKAVITKEYADANYGKPTLSKGTTISDPTAADDATLFYTPVAITVTSVASHIVGTVEVAFNIQHSSTRTGTPNNVFTSDIRLTSTAGQVNSSGFDDATIPAGSWVWVNIDSVSGTPDLFHTTVIYTED